MHSVLSTSTNRRQDLQTSLKRKKVLLKLLSKNQNLVNFVSESGGVLSPDVRVNPASEPNLVPACVKQVGRYLLLDVRPAGAEQEIRVYRAVNIDTKVKYVCKVLPHKYRGLFSTYWSVGTHPHINSVLDLIVGSSEVYAFFSCHYGDLHTYVRQKRRIPEAEVAELFRQILSAVRYCLGKRVLVRDIKLRKFVFKDEARTQLMLQDLEDSVLLPTSSPHPNFHPFPSEPSLDEDFLGDLDDWVVHKHGCPAYISPEIINSVPSPSVAREYVQLRSHGKVQSALQSAVQSADQSVFQSSVQLTGQSIIRDQSNNSQLTADQSTSIFTGLHGLTHGITGVRDSMDRLQGNSQGNPGELKGKAQKGYSGQGACVWSLGVILYTMLAGQYPFHDTNPSALFVKICRGHYTAPPNVSTLAKCVISGMLRVEPRERLSLSELWRHPWLKSGRGVGWVGAECERREQAGEKGVRRSLADQIVPDIQVVCDNDSFFN